MVYKQKRVWKEGAYAKVDPEIAGEQFDRLAAENRLNAEEVVRENTPDDAPLHGEFVWDDKVAAHEYRKERARSLMRHLAFVTVETPEAPQRCYFKVEPNSSNYEPIQQIVQSVDKTKLLIQTAYREMVSYRDKFQGVLQTCGATVDVEAVLEKLKENA